MGILDGPLRDVSSTIIGLFTDELAVFTRNVVIDYDEEEDTEIVLPVAARVKVSPPYPFEVKYVDGDTVLSTDLQSFVSALDLEAEDFDPVPTSGVTVSLEIGGVTYNVQAAERFMSGDQVALYQLQLRG